MPSLVTKATASSWGGQSAARATVLRALLCVGLTVIVLVELAGGLPIAPVVTAAPSPSTHLGGSYEPTRFDPPGREVLDIIVARPLFSPSRRPFVAAHAPQAAQETPETSALELIGVLWTVERRSALIRPLQGGRSRWVREGETMAGWTIATIAHRRVHLRAGDRLVVLELRADNSIPAED
jgi:hypothetical protein